MTDDSLLPFDLPAVRRKKVSAGFEGGPISSDGGPVLLREAERRLRLADTLTLGKGDECFAAHDRLEIL